MDLKQTTGRGKMVKVQHVYKACQLRINEEDQKRFPANCVSLCSWSCCVCSGFFYQFETLMVCYYFLCVFADIFPSTCEEWEPLDVLTGSFEAQHVDFGKLLYAGCLASDLVNRNIFFYEAMYVVPMSSSTFGRLQSIPSPTLADPDWPVPDNALMTFTSRKIETNIYSAMKCTYGSHRATITFFMPLHLFVFLFKVGNVHRTPTMWIAKGGTALHRFLPQSWESKITQHNGDTIKCALVADRVVSRYHIAKQQLSIIFPYRRWKRTGGDWEALDSDLTNVEQVDLHISVHDDVWDVPVNEDWSLLHLRDYLALRFALKIDYTFLVGGNPVRKRQEKTYFCKDIPFPRCIHVKPTNPL